MGIEPPQEHSDIGNVVTPAGDAAGVDGMGNRVECGADPFQLFPVSQVGRRKAAKTRMVHVLCHDQMLKILDGARVPSGYAVRESLQDAGRSLAPAVGDRTSNGAARAGDRRGDAVERAVADQIANIRREPGRTGFDKLVVVKLIEVFAQHRDLLADHGEQACQRTGHAALLQLGKLLLVSAGALGFKIGESDAFVRIEPAGRDRGQRLVTNAQDRGQSLQQFVGVGAPAMTPRAVRAGLSIHSSAALALPLPRTPGSAASSRGCGSGGSGPVSLRYNLLMSAANTPGTVLTRSANAPVG